MSLVSSLCFIVISSRQKLPPEAYQGIHRSDVYLLIRSPVQCSNCILYISLLALLTPLYSNGTAVSVTFLYYSERSA